MDHQRIHQMAVDAAKGYQSSEVRLIEVLQIVNRARVYKTLGYTSLFTYAVEALGLPPERVYQLNAVAKKCDEVPALKQAIDDGVLNVSKARRITSVIEKGNPQDWIKKAATLPQRKLEKEIAKASPRSSVPTKTKPLNETDALLSLSISIEALEQLERLQEVLSQKEQRAVTLKDAIEAAARLALDKVDPLKRAKRSINRKMGKTKRADSPIFSSRRKSPRFIPASLKHQVTLRDRGRCTKQVNGTRCPQTRWLDVHHVVPLSQGGKNELENLVTLCSGHHRMTH